MFVLLYCSKMFLSRLAILCLSRKAFLMAALLIQFCEYYDGRLVPIKLVVSRYFWLKCWTKPVTWAVIYMCFGCRFSYIDTICRLDFETVSTLVVFLVFHLITSQLNSVISKTCHRCHDSYPVWSRRYLSFIFSFGLLCFITGFSPDTPVSSFNKTDHYDIAYVTKFLLQNNVQNDWNVISDTTLYIH